MGLTLVTPPAAEPVSLAEAKAHCRITHPDEDGLIAGYLMAARAHAEVYTRRAFVTQTWDLKLDDGWPRQIRASTTARSCAYRVDLPKAPAQSITSISYVDTDGTLQTLAADQYRLLRANQERDEAAVEPAYGVTWPSVRQQGETITVRFVCGYDAVLNPFPEPIRQAILLLVQHWNENREAVVIGTIVNELPLAVESLLFPYRLFY